MGQVRVNRAFVEPYLKSLNPRERRRVRAAIRALADDPRPQHLEIKVLESDPDGTRFYRIRLGPHRIIYSVQGADIFVHRAFDRRDGYGWLERA
jgi:mRNA-degrading endonuclease RelE of RelBE toxin-antitoxin system